MNIPGRSQNIEDEQAIGRNADPSLNVEPSIEESPPPRDDASIEAALSIAIGIVLFENTRDQLVDLARTLNRAIDRLAASGEAGHPSRASVHSVRLLNNGKMAVDVAVFRPDVEVIASAENLGFGRAHNLLMRDAFGEGAGFYLALNPDGMLHPDVLVELAAVARLGGGPALIEATQFPEELAKVFDSVTLSTPWASGCCLLIPASIHQRLGGFDENLFLYCEDVDLSWRARLAGYAVRQAPRALIAHSLNSPGVSRAKRQAHLQAAHYLAAKWGNEPFARRIERDLAAAGCEPIRPLRCEPVSPAPPIPDFDHYLGFAPTRWSFPPAIPDHAAAEARDGEDAIDVVVRFHDPAQIRRLSRCLFSIYAQRHQPIRALIMLPGFDDAALAAVAACVEAFDWSAPRRKPVVTNVAVAATGDRRSLLWNAGVDLSRARYLGFCDFDDIVYAAGYGYLLHRLRSGEAKASIASSLLVDCVPMDGFDFVCSKTCPALDERHLPYEFCSSNCLLVDLFQIEREQLYMDLTDPQFTTVLARIFWTYRTDCGGIGTIVGEHYRRV